LKNSKGIQLLHKYLYRKPNFEEKAKIDKWYEAIDEANDVADSNELLRIKEKLYLRTWGKLNSGARVIPFYEKTLFCISVGVIAAVCITSVYFLYLKRPDSSVSIAEVHSPLLKQDVAAPAVNKAVLTLQIWCQLYDCVILNSVLKNKNIF
jgi:hypothetical protein